MGKAKPVIGKLLPKAEEQGTPAPVDHSRRNAAFVAGAILATGGGLALQQRAILKREEQTLQHAAKRGRAEAYRDTIKKIAEKAKAKPPKDVHRGIAESVIRQNRFRIDFPAPTHPNYERHLGAIMQHVHAPIEGAAGMTEKEINAVKSQRIYAKVDELKMARDQRITEGDAKSRFHNTVVAPHFKNYGLPVDTTEKGFNEVAAKEIESTGKSERTDLLRRMTYSHPHREMIDPLNPPTLSEVEKRREARHHQSTIRPGLKKLPPGSPLSRTPTGLSRLVKLIEFDYNPKEKRNSSGQWSSGEVMIDPHSLQYAYHAPLVNPNGNGAPVRRGRGRPPGSPNRNTIATRQVQEDAMSQQPESRGSSLGTKALIGAGLIGGAGLVLGPKIAPVIKSMRRDSAAVARIGAKIGTELPGGGIFGEKLSMKAAKQGVSIEEAIQGRVRNIQKIRDKRLQSASAWRKAHPNKPAEANPYAPAHNEEGVTQWPPKKQTVSERKTTATIAAEKARAGQAKAQVNVITEQLAHTHTKQALDATKAELRTVREKQGETSQAFKDLTKKHDELEKKLASVVVEPTHTQKVRAAMKTLDQIHNPPDGGYRTEAGFVTEKQDELFVTANVTRPHLAAGNSIVPSSGLSDVGAAAEHLEFLKQRLRQTHADQIAHVAATGGHDPEHVAEAMALRRMAGYSTHVAAPAVGPLPATGLGTTTRDIEEHARALANQHEDLINADKSAKLIAEKHITDAGHQAREAYDEVLKKQGVTKLNPTHKEERNRQVRAAQERASHAIAKQLVSEGRVPREALRGVPRGRKASAKELAFARRVVHRIELQQKTKVPVLEPHMISATEFGMLTEPIVDNELLDGIARYLKKKRLGKPKLLPRARVEPRSASTGVPLFGR